MFGIANQLIGSVALAVGTTILINMGRAKYAWVTLAPLAFLSVTTLSAGFLSVRDNFWPMAVGTNPALVVRGYVNSICTSILMVCVLIIFISAMRRWLNVWSGKAPAPAELAEA
jgi:carbon starvation protein